jgi:hypothetical protein
MGKDNLREKSVIDMQIWDEKIMTFSAHITCALAEKEKYKNTTIYAFLLKKFGEKIMSTCKYETTS